MKSNGMPEAIGGRASMGARRSGAVAERYSRLDPAQQRAAVLWLCWRAVWRWEPRAATASDGTADRMPAVRAAREALVLLGTGGPTVDQAAALLAQLDTPAASAADRDEPAAVAIRALLSEAPHGDPAPTTLQQAVAAFGPEALSELALALDQQSPGERPRPRPAGRLMADLMLGLLHVVLVFAIPLSAPIGTRHDWIVLAVVAAILLPALVEVTRRRVDRWRVATFLISGAFSAWIYFTDTLLLLFLGPCCD